MGCLRSLAIPAGQVVKMGELAERNIPLPFPSRAISGDFPWGGRARKKVCVCVVCVRDVCFLVRRSRRQRLSRAVLFFAVRVFRRWRLFFGGFGTLNWCRTAVGCFVAAIGCILFCETADDVCVRVSAIHHVYDIDYSGWLLGVFLNREDPPRARRTW